MKKISIKKMQTLLSILCMLLFSMQVFAQSDIYQMMERTDMSITEVKNWAENYFKNVDKLKSSEYKQYQRWLYERNFHLDAKGYFIKPELEDQAYYRALRNMRLQPRSSTWSELGPQSWTYTSGWNPGVGRLTSVAIHPSDTTIIYVSSPGGGIWKSTNSGSTWTPLIDFVNSSWMNVFHLCIDPLNTNTIYASLSSGGVLKSTNAGVTWSTTGSGPSGTKQVKVHPSNSSIVFAAANNGIWRSTNGGASWTQTETNTKEDIEFNPSNSDIMYASGSSGTSCVWRSTNNGVNWTAISVANGITNTGRTLIAVSPSNPAVVYAVQASGSLFGRMYRSTDSGATYTTTVVGSPSSGTNYFGYEPTGTGTSGQATYDMAICVNPSNANDVHIAGIICWRSTNGGTSFVATTVWSYPNSTGYNHADVHGLEWVNNTLYSVSDGGIYKSINNAGDWTDLSAGLGIRQFYRIACSKTDPNVVTTGAQDNGSSFRRTNGSWVDWLGADGMDNIISPTNAAIAIGTSQYGSIYKTTNSGASRTNLSNPTSGNWVTPIVMHPTSHDTVYGGWQGVFRSVNGGSSFTKISGTISNYMDALAVAPSNTRYIYASSSTSLFRTTDGGATWTTIAAPSSITSIFVSKNDPLKIWITCNSSTNRVYVSTDGGTTLSNLSTGLPSLSARSVVVDEDAIETIYVGMNIGVYFRDNVTNTWTLHGTGLPLVAVNEVEIQKSGNKLRVATYGRGVWQSDLQNIPIPCSVPAGLATTSINTTSATLSWAAASGAVSYRIEYKLSSDTSWTLLNSAHNSLNIGLSGLASSSSYDWRVRSNCASSNSNFAQTSFTTLTPTCPAVTGLQTTSITTSQANLSWNNEPNAVSYRVEYKFSSDTTWTLLSSNGNSTSILLSGLSSSSSYDWRVRSNCATLNSNFTQASFTTATPSCPNISGLQTTGISTSQATLGWNNEPFAVSYRIEYKLSSDTTWTLLSSAHTSTSINLTGLASSSSYDWRVRSNCATLNSGFTQTSFTTLSPACPSVTGLQTTGISTSQATLGWNNEPSAVSYRLEYKLSSDTTWTLLSSAHTSTSIALTGLTSSSSYDWRVRSNCATLNSGFTQTSFTTLTACPDVTGLQTISTTSTQASLSWNNLGSASSYAVEYKLAAATNWTPTAGSSTNSITIGSLSAGLYNWRVKAICGANNGNFSSPSNFTIYCASTGASNTTSYIDKVLLGSINRISGNDGGYYNGTATSTSIKPGTAYKIKVSPDYPGSNQNTYWRVYIDYNQDGDFTDANEQVGEARYKGKNDKDINFTVPSTASIGLTRMRVSFSMTAYQASCSSFASGEVEDFTVNITNTPDPAPSIPGAISSEPEPFKIFVHPNPAKDEIQVNYFLNEEEDRIELQIFDMQGRSVLGSILSGKKDINKNAIDISTLGSGQYLLQLRSPNILERSNFIIQK